MSIRQLQQQIQDTDKKLIYLKARLADDRQILLSKTRAFLQKPLAWMGMIGLGYFGRKYVARFSPAVLSALKKLFVWPMFVLKNLLLEQFVEKTLRLLKFSSSTTKGSEQKHVRENLT